MLFPQKEKEKKKKESQSVFFCEVVGFTTDILCLPAAVNYEL